MSEPSSSQSKTPTPGGPTLRPHIYDGIQEYDQRLPNWWLFTLYIAIAATLVWWLYHFQFGLGQTDEHRVEKEVTAVLDLQKGSAAASTAGLDDSKFWDMSKDSVAVERGKAVFSKICFSCHAPDLTSKMAGGVQLPGVSLVDAEWKYGGKPLDMVKMVNTGTPNPAENLTKGLQVMPPKGGLPLTPDEIKDVVVYVLSFNKQGPDNKAVPKG